MKFAPHDYQRGIIEFMLDNPFGAIFADPGTGKTVATLSVVKALNLIDPLIRVLVVAPLRPLALVWPAEIDKWDHISLTYQNGRQVADTARGVSDIAGINFEQLPKYLNQCDALERWPFDALVVDESSRFKSHKGKRFKHLKKYLDRFERRYILTGTPNPQSYLDLWSQLFIVDRGESLGKNISKYRKTYFYPTPQYYGGVKWEIRTGAAEEIQAAIAPVCYRVEAAFGKIHYHDIPIALPPSAKKNYVEMEKKLYAELDGEKKLATNAAHGYGLCAQIAGGAMYDGDGYKTIHNEKIDALDELLGELQGKNALIAYMYRHELDRLRKAFPDAPHLGAGVSDSETVEIVGRWNAGEIPILLGHPASIGHGLNLQAGGRIVVWFTLSDSLELYLQFNRRIYRQGADGATHVYHLIAKDTVDELKLKRLKNKDFQQKTLLDALKTYRKEQNE